MWIRYDLSTRREIYRSTVPFTMPLSEGEAEVELPDEAIIGPKGAYRVTEDLTGLEVDPALVPPPAVNGPAFIKAVMLDAFLNDPARITTVWKLQPVWWPAAKEENWPLVQAITTAALTAGDITQGEYDAIAAAALAHHIPVTL